VSIDMSEGVTRHFETKSNKKGEFVQIGLPPGGYSITAEKDKMGSAPVMTRVRVGTPSEVTVVVGAGMGAAGNKEAAAKSAELKKAFEEGIAASQAGNHDAAVAAFSHAAEVNPNCFDCHYNMAYSYAQKKEYDKAEAEYKKAIEL